jgi:hydrogenase maturation protein HypF
VGAIFDGAGLGPDATVWGGEILVGDLSGYERAGCLFPVRLPGGDAAAREPWRMACAWLCAGLGVQQPELPTRLRSKVSESEWEAVCRLVASGVGSPPTTSVGRLFDAVAALCGLRARVSHEGQAAMELEGCCDPRESGAYPMPLIAPADGPTILDARETFAAIAADVERGAKAGTVAARFHHALAEATTAALRRELDARGIEAVVLSGGVFQNRALLEGVAAALVSGGARVLLPERLPPNDGQISYGQAVVAIARERGGR